MKMVFRLIIFLISLNAFTCELKEKVVSLSGSVTFTLEHLGLLKDNNLKAISVFHPIKENSFQGEVLGGGLFLSFKHMNTHYQGMKIFFDQSRELSRMFKRLKKSNNIEVKTADLDPFQVYESTLKSIKPSLNNCEKRINDLNKEIAAIKGRVIAKKFTPTMFFYLGSFQVNGNSPKMLMVNDGPVRFLKENTLIETYPSELSYVTWSQKILKQFPKAIHIGLDNGNYDKIEMLRLSTKKMTLKYRGLLIPGISQIFFLDKFSKLTIF